MPNRYAVMGNPIAHSLSPLIHSMFAEQGKYSLVYDKILVDPLVFEASVRTFFHEGGLGLNITLPFKERALALCDEVSDRARLAGASNTLSFCGGAILGDNTDGIGLLRDLNRFIALREKSILMLGAGGAARGVLGVLLQQNPKAVTVANRSVERAQALQSAFQGIDVCALESLKSGFDVIIHATSSGIRNEKLVLSDSLLQNKPFCYDLSYRQTGDTAFVAWARRLGCSACDGLGMLIEQAAEAFFIWHGIMPMTKPVLEALFKEC